MRTEITPQMRALWAKKDNSGLWLPLVVHLADAAETAKILWDTWVSGTIKDRIADDLVGSVVTARELFVFLSAVHDVGKCSPVFQCKTNWDTQDVDKDLFAILRNSGLPVCVFPTKVGVFRAVRIVGARIVSTESVE